MNNNKKSVSKPHCVAMEIYPIDSSDYECQLVKSLVNTVMCNNGLSGFLSPLHKPEGDATKYHYHLMIIRPSRCGFSMGTWRDLANILCAVNDYVLPLSRPHEYARYLIHNGYSDKIQYSANDVITYGDLDYKSYIKFHDSDDSIKADKNVVIIDILNYLSKNSVVMFAELVDYCIVCKQDWLPVVKSNTNFLISYMRSMEYKGWRKD